MINPEKLLLFKLQTESHYLYQLADIITSTSPTLSITSTLQSHHIPYYHIEVSSPESRIHFLLVTVVTPLIA